MKIMLASISLDTESSLAVLAKAKVHISGKVELEGGLEIPFKEDLLPQEAEYIKDGLADAVSRVQERILNAIRAEQE